MIRRLLIALALGALLAGCSVLIKGVPAHAQVGGPIYCGAFAQIAPSSATTTIIVPKAASGTARTYICGYSLQGTAGTTQLVYGTGSNCGTGTTQLSPIFAAGTVGSDQSSTFRGLAAPSGNDVCVITGTGTTASQAIVVYVQQ